MNFHKLCVLLQELVIYWNYKVYRLSHCLKFIIEDTCYADWLCYLMSTVLEFLDPC